jgi:23S rRNA (pseudouridine1915-N3)-methyltransferase
MKLRIDKWKYSKNGWTASLVGQKEYPSSCWSHCGILLSMQLTLAHVGPRSGTRDSYETLIQEYVNRCSARRGEPECRTESFRTEAALMEWLDRQRGRTAAVAVLLDEHGRQMTSEAFAGWLGKRQEEGSQQIVFAVGPADGWSDAARTRAQLLLSLGPMTLAHALARLVMAEQILSGHPYHRQ